MGKLVVVNGANTKCTGSEQSSFLLVPPDLQIEIDGLNPATIVHHIPGDNIIPFGPCKHLGEGMCAPVTTSPWDEGEPSVPFGPDPSLNMESRLKCDLGGTIKLLSSGQSNPFLSTDCNVSLSAQLFADWYERRRIADAIKAQMDAENEAERKEIDEGATGFWGNFASTGLDLVPFVGWGKGVAEAIDGRDLITRKKLKWWERALGAIPGGKYGKKAADGVGTIKRGIKGGGDEAGEKAAKNSGTATRNIPVQIYTVPANVRDKVPAGWKVQHTEKRLKKGKTKKTGGTRFYHPDKNNKQEIRYMPVKHKYSTDKPNSLTRSPLSPLQLPMSRVIVKDKEGRNLQADGSLTPEFTKKDGEVMPPGNIYHPKGHQRADTFQGNLGE